MSITRFSFPDTNDDMDLANDRFVQRYDLLADRIASEYARYFPTVENPQEHMSSEDWSIRQEYLAMKDRAEEIMRFLTEEPILVSVNWKEGF